MESSSRLLASFAQLSAEDRALFTSGLNFNTDTERQRIFLLNYLDLIETACHCLQYEKPRSVINNGRLFNAMIILLHSENAPYDAALIPDLNTQANIQFGSSLVRPSSKPNLSFVKKLTKFSLSYRNIIQYLATLLASPDEEDSQKPPNTQPVQLKASANEQDSAEETQVEQESENEEADSSHKTSTKKKKKPKTPVNCIELDKDGQVRVLKIVSNTCAATSSQKPLTTERLYQAPLTKDEEVSMTDQIATQSRHDQSLMGIIQEHLRVKFDQSDRTKFPETEIPYKTPSRSSRSSHLDHSIAPVSSIKQAFSIIAGKICGDTQFQAACSSIAGHGLRIFTMCSGTESPILALQLLGTALAQNGLAHFPIDHVGSAEIVPFKQAYIQRNFNPPVLFRDVTEFAEADVQPHTAYGGTAPQPNNVHILIAGSSCVDYSNLNEKRKTFGQKGQSYDTLQGISNYAKNHRPAVIVLENVSSAPWSQIRDHFNDLGYFCIVMKLDTKNFYIPQTRERGYMIAFDKKRAADIGFDLREAADTVVKIMVKLCQRASSPYTDFIFSDDDPELQVSERVLTRLDRNKQADSNNTDWSKCRVRYAGFRSDHKLGINRPLTFWRNNGKCTFPDYAWVSWARLQRERIWDTLDINHLLFVTARDYDANYKSKWLDLSQNVDRNSDTNQWGVVGCITPSGAPYDTRRGGPVFGKEVLALQGIPAQDLSLNKESSSQLQDLAGNAMTSTVVCAVMLSAFIASTQTTATSSEADVADSQVCKAMFEDIAHDGSTSRDHKLFAPHAPKPFDQSDFENRLNDASLSHCTLATLPISGSSAGLLDALQGSQQLCRCEGSSINPPKFFLICTTCGHTTCCDCAGNPKHNYNLLNLTRPRQSPSTVFDTIKEFLPPLLRLQLTATEKQEILNHVTSLVRDFDEHEFTARDDNPTFVTAVDREKYADAISRALQSTLHFHTVKRERTWRVVFKSPTAIIELRIDPVHEDAQSSTGFDRIADTKLTWVLFAIAPSEEPARCWLRDVLAYPIARMEPIGDNVFEGCWEYWLPRMQTVSLELRGETEINSWERDLGITEEKYRQLTVFSRIDVRSSLEHTDSDPVLRAQLDRVLRKVCGTYQTEQGCSAACGSLHRKVSPFTAADDQSACFFYLDPQHIGNASLDRFVFSSSHERLPLGCKRQVLAQMERGWRPSTQNLLSEEYSTFTCRVVDCWQPTKSLQFDRVDKSDEINFWVPSDLDIGTVTESSCDEISKLFVAKLPLINSFAPKQWIAGSRYVINLMDRFDTLEDYRWLLEQMHRVLPIGMKQIIHIDIPKKECACAPMTPDLEWVISRKANTKQMIIRPFENAETATAFEKALRKRPLPIMAELYWSGDHGFLVMQLNVATLAHRLYQKVQSSNMSTEFTWSFQKVSEFDVTPGFPSIVLYSRNDPNIWPAGDAQYQSKLSVEKPTHFAKRTLWKSQRETLAWMLRIESGQVTWSEWDCEDVDLPVLRLRLEVEADTTVPVTGGVIADEVGAGKTTTSLALVARSLENKSDGIMNQKVLPSGKIPSKATLILVPENLIKQWQDEINICFGLSGKSCARKLIITVISKQKSIDQYTVQELKNADIVLTSWNVFESPVFWTQLRKFCWIANVPEDAGRGLQQWLDTAVADLGDLALQSDGCTKKDAFWRHRENLAAEKKDRYSKFKGYCQVKSQNLNTKKKLAIKELDHKHAKAAFPVPTQSHKVPVDWDFDDLKDDWGFKQKRIVPFLHFFRFQRLIVDEFTYLGPKTLMAVMKLDAEHRWMLSGTPPLTTFDSINTVAKLLGTRITLENETTGVFTFGKAKINTKNDKSYAEEFREQAKARAPAWVRKRNEKANQFAQSFIHQSLAPKVEVEQHTYYIGTQYFVTESMIYHKAYHHLMRQTVKFTGAQITPPNGLNQDEKMLHSLEQAPNAEAALLCCCADLLKHVTADKNGMTGKKTEREICEDMIVFEEDAVKTLADEIFLALKEALFLWGFADMSDPSEFTPSRPKVLSAMAAYLHSICDGTFGDTSVESIMTDLVVLADAEVVTPKQRLSSSKGLKKGRRDRPLAPAYDVSRELPIKERQKETKQRATDLNEMTRELVDRAQRLRLLRTILEIISGTTVFACSNCDHPIPLPSLKVLILCGHVSCDHCLEQSEAILRNPMGCVVEGCTASAGDSNIPAVQFVGRGNALVSRYGSKMLAVVAKIKQILAGQSQERILVFVQFDAIVRQLFDALNANAISYADATKNTESVINKLKAGWNSGHANGARILILKIDGADAAGWNLQEYNHVMFVAPLQAKTNYDFHSTMTQAVGRALRFGQKKDVHVYHFVTINTGEVNCLEQRYNKKFVRLADGSFDLVSARRAEGMESLTGPCMSEVTRQVVEMDGSEEDENEDDDDGADE